MQKCLTRNSRTFAISDDKAKTADKASSLENEASSRQSKSEKKEVRQAESTPPSG
jgi:hypothetical protein